MHATILELAKGATVELCIDSQPGICGIQQGVISDLWLLNAIALLCSYGSYLLTTLFVPTGQEGNGRYCIRIYKVYSFTSSMHLVAYSEIL
jgi:hypothetical protein